MTRSSKLIIRQGVEHSQDDPTSYFLKDPNQRSGFEPVTSTLPSTAPSTELTKLVVLIERKLYSDLSKLCQLLPRKSQ